MKHRKQLRSLSWNMNTEGIKMLWSFLRVSFTASYRNIKGSASCLPTVSPDRSDRWRCQTWHGQSCTDMVEHKMQVSLLWPMSRGLNGCLPKRTCIGMLSILCNVDSAKLLCWVCTDRLFSDFGQRVYQIRSSCGVARDPTASYVMLFIRIHSRKKITDSPICITRRESICLGCTMT